MAVRETEEDDQAAWLRAGQSLERVRLEATAGRLAVSLLTQPLELSRRAVGEVRQLIRA